jgi:hypothetical protein
MDIDPPPLHSGHPRGKPVYYYVLLIERDMKDVTVVVMSLPDCSPDCPVDCPRHDFPVNEMPSIFQVRNRKISCFQSQLSNRPVTGKASED